MRSLFLACSFVLLASLVPTNASIASGSTVTMSFPAHTPQLLFFRPGHWRPGLVNRVLKGNLKGSGIWGPLLKAYLSQKSYPQKKSDWTRRKLLQTIWRHIDATRAIVLAPTLYDKWVSNGTQRYGAFLRFPIGKKTYTYHLYQQWYIPSKRPIKLRNALRRWLKGYGFRVRAKAAALTGVKGALVMSVGRLYKLALIVPEGRGLKVIYRPRQMFGLPPSWLTQPVTKAMRKAFWRRLHGYEDRWLKQMATPKAAKWRRTPALALALSSRYALSCYVRDKGLREQAAVLGLTEALMALDSATADQKIPLLKRYMVYATLQGHLTLSPVSTHEDLAILLRFRPQLQIDWVNSLTAAGKRAYLAGRRGASAFVPLGQPTSLRYSFYAHIKKMIYATTRALPGWFALDKGRKKGSPFVRFQKAFRNAGRNAQAAWMVSGPWFLLSGLFSLRDRAPLASLRAYLPSQLSFSMLTAKKKGAPALMRLLYDKKPKDKLLLALVRRLFPRQMTMKLALRHVRLGRRHCVLVGFHLGSLERFARHCRVRPYRKTDTFQATVSSHVLRSMLSNAWKQYRFRSLMTPWWPHAKTQLTSAIRLRGWSTDRMSVFSLALGRKKLLPPVLKGAVAASLPMPAQWPPKGAAACFWMARGSLSRATVALGEAHGKTPTSYQLKSWRRNVRGKAEYRASMRLRKKHYQSFLRLEKRFLRAVGCLSRSSKYRRDARVFRRLWKGLPRKLPRVPAL